MVVLRGGEAMQSGGFYVGKSTKDSGLSSAALVLR